MLQVSSKVTSSIVSFCKKKGFTFPLEDITSQIFPYPFESLKEPDLWLRASRTEKFLAKFQKFYPDQKPHIITQVAHHCAELKSWGTLDAVMILMEKPSSFYQKPEKFLTYFLNPTISLEGFKKNENFVEFIFPISSKKFPCLTTYFKSVLEALPSFIGKNFNKVLWDENDKVLVSWGDTQQAFWNQKTTSNKELQESLEKASKILEERNKEIELLKDSLNSCNLSKKNHSLDFIRDQIISNMSDSLLTLNDYLLRTEQFIGFIKNDKALNPEKIQSFLKKLDLENISKKRSEIYQQVNHYYKSYESFLNEKPHNVSS